MFSCVVKFGSGRFRPSWLGSGALPIVAISLAAFMFLSDSMIASFAASFASARPRESRNDRCASACKGSAAASSSFGFGGMTMSSISSTFGLAADRVSSFGRMPRARAIKAMMTRCRTSDARMASVTMERFRAAEASENHGATGAFAEYWAELIKEAAE